MRPRLVQHLLGAAALGIGVAGAGSEKSELAGEVSIESAKREFDTLRDASGVSSEAQLRMPKISGPQMPMADEPSGAMVPTPKATLQDQREKERSENWLLEAMLEQPENDTETDSLKKEQEALRADPFKRMIAEQLSTTKKNEDEEAELAEADQIADQVVNPLSAFMAGWVSDQDRKLLVPEAKPNSGEGWLGGSSAPALGASVNHTSSFTTLSSEMGTFDRVEEAERTNPYLDFQTPVFEEPVNRAPTQMVPQYPREPIDRSSLEQAPAPRSPTTVSPLIDRDDEAKKYFPQLKRF